MLGLLGFCIGEERRGIDMFIGRFFLVFSATGGKSVMIPQSVSCFFMSSLFLMVNE